jgi:hypothetical protein
MNSFEHERRVGAFRLAVCFTTEATKGGPNAETPFAWEDLGKFKAESRFLNGYPDDQKTFLAAYARAHRNPQIKRS